MEEERIAKVLHNMKEQELSQFLICDPISIFYLTGAFILPGERFYALYLKENGKHVMFMNELFTAPEDLGIDIVYYNDVLPITDMVAERIDHTAILGVDKNITARFLLPLQEKKAAAGYVVASLCVDLARGCKDAREQEMMKKVSAINDLAMAEFKKLIIPGVTEKQIADQMLEIYKKLGADGYSFEPLVIFGENGAEAHHIPDDTVLKEGRSVIFDVGCCKDLYCADMTRTFFYRKISEKHRELYDLVKKANETAIAMLKPGVQLKEIDKIARDIITKAGYGQYFTHRLGHFIGMEVHEYGDVSAVSDIIAVPGMIFSIEPGIYLKGEVGIRIEDLVLVTEKGCVRLNQYSKDLEILE